MQRLAGIFNVASSQSTSGRDGPPGRPSLPPRPAVAPYQTVPTGKLSLLQEDETRYYATAVIEKTDQRLKVATISWLKEPLQSWFARAENQVPGAIATTNATFTLSNMSDPTVGCMDDTWTATSGTPSGRSGHTAIWTGTEMIVWGGGTNNFVLFNSGGRYNPSTDSWTPTSTTNAPQGRYYHTAVWTGSEMVVWGGWDGGTYFDSGGRVQSRD